MRIYSVTDNYYNYKNTSFNGAKANLKKAGEIVGTAASVVNLLPALAGFAIAYATDRFINSNDNDDPPTPPDHPATY